MSNPARHANPFVRSRIVRLVAVVASILAPIGLAPLFAQNNPPPIPRIDDKALLEQMPGSELKTPPRLFTPELLTKIERGEVSAAFLALDRGNPARGRRWLAIDDDRWRAMIAPHAPVSMAKMYTTTSGTCPFCGEPFREPVMSDEEFVESPFQVKTACCGATVYEREADMPDNYKARPNHTETIPHLDGATFDYRFHVPPGKKDAPPGRRSERRHWFCSAGEVWRARMRVLTTRVIPDLMARVFEKDDARAARALAAIFDRLADVYPGLPLYAWAQDDTGIARGRDDRKFLTRKEYLAHPRPAKYELPYWHRGYNYAKLNAHLYGWRDGVTGQAGMFAEAWDLLRDRPEVRAYSRERHDDAGRWQQRVRKNVVDEAALLAAVSPPTRGNTVIGWIRGGVRLGAVTGQEYFLRTALELVETYIPNAHFSDGLSTEGAFNYSTMNRRILRSRWMLEHFGGVDPMARYPILEELDKHDYRIRTLLGVESMHGDQHGTFFHSLRMRPPETIDYAANAPSQCFPVTGLAALRSGGAGRRLEAIMDFQSGVGHTHLGRLNLQLFYQGVNLLPDLGYGTRFIDPDRPPWSAAAFNFEKMENPFPGEAGPFFGLYTARPQTHCTALVDGRNHKLGPATFRRFLGGQPSSGPGYQAQFVEADAVGVFADHPDPVDRFHRQLVTLTLADGRSLLVSVFRLRGGRRHDMLWHTPAPDPASSLGQPEALPEKTLLEYLKTEIDPRTHSLLTSLHRHRPDDNAWRHTWTVRPEQYLPTSEEGHMHAAPWKGLLENVRLRLWSADAGGEARREVLTARGPWPSMIQMRLPGGRRVGKLIALKEALSFLIETRTAGEPGLESTFVHVLEPTLVDQAATLHNVTTTRARGDSDAVLCALRPAGRDGKNDDILVATTHDGGRAEFGELRMRGRLGVVDAARGRLALFDGSRLASRGWRIEVEPTARLRLAGVIGDLTGSPQESALVVDSARPLPTGGALVGRTIAVAHRIGPRHTTGYTIAKVSPHGPGRYRIDLAGHPPFMLHRMAVRAIDDDNPRRMTSDFRFFKGQGRGLYKGRRIRFPRSGFECAMAGTPTRGWNTDRFVLAEAPPEGAVAVGDPLVIYQIQPGDEVVIPSHVALESADTDGGRTIDLVATGAVELTVPGAWRMAVRLNGDGERVALEGERTEDGLTVRLSQEEVGDGRVRILLRE